MVAGKTWIPPVSDFADDGPVEVDDLDDGIIKPRVDLSGVTRSATPRDQDNCLSIGRKARRQNLLSRGRPDELPSCSGLRRRRPCLGGNYKGHREADGHSRTDVHVRSLAKDGSVHPPNLLFCCKPIAPRVAIKRLRARYYRGWRDVGQCPPCPSTPTERKHFPLKDAALAIKELNDRKATGKVVVMVE